MPPVQVLRWRRTCPYRGLNGRHVASTRRVEASKKYASLLLRQTTSMVDTALLPPSPPPAAAADIAAVSADFLDVDLTNPVAVSILLCILHYSFD